MYPKFLYYLIKADGRSAQVINNVVSYTGQRKPQPYSPDGWQTLTIMYERSLTRHGLSGAVSLPFGFPLQGAHILRDAIYKSTTEEELFLLIQKLKLNITDDTFEWFYDYFFKGEIQFTKTEDSQDIFKVPIGESGLARLMKANEKTVYSFPLSDPECVWLKHDGIKKSYTKKYVIEQNQEVTGVDDFFLGMFAGISEGSNPNIAFFDVPFQTATAYPNGAYFTETAADTQLITIKGYLNIYFNEAVSPVLQMQDNGGPAAAVNVIPFGAAGVQGTVVKKEFNVTTTLGALSKFSLKLFGGDPLAVDPQYTVLSGEIEILYDIRKATTYFKCYTRSTLFRKLVGKITGDESKAVSQLCEDYDSLLITSGNGIRNFTDAVVNASYLEFLQDTDATLMAGDVYLPDRVELERREKYYSEDEVYDLGQVKDFMKRPAEDYKCNTFKFGHARQTIEDINGKYDPNGNNQYSGPLTKSVKEYSMVSPWKAGPYEIEDLRTTLEGQTTTDDNSDSDTFVIAATPNPDFAGEVVFDSVANSIEVPDTEGFFTGQQIQVTGSALNDGVYDILNIVDNLLIVSQAVATEAAVAVTITWLRGRMYLLDRPAYDVLEGVPNDTIFNLPLLTPKTMLKRHGRWIASMNAGLANKHITFTSGKDNKNTALRTELAGVVIDEDADETISDLGTPLFFPWEFVFKTEVPADLPELLENNPNLCFKFTDEYGEEWAGFSRMAGIASNEYTPQEYRLLAAPSNDILKLIH